MPQAVTHILVPILIASFYRDFFVKKKKDFPLHYVLIAGLAGVLPDIDIAISLLLSFLNVENWWLHKTFTHSIFFPIASFVLFLIFKEVKTEAKICNIGRHKLKLSIILLAIFFGTSVHLLLDTLIGNQSYLFYPFSDIDYGLNLVSHLPYNSGLIMATLDGALLIIWLVYLELKHKISDFI